MKPKIFFFLYFILAGINIVNGALFIQQFDKSAFYNVMKSGGIREINTELALVDAASIKEKEAYAGVLLMKKAGLAEKPKDKLNLFRSGRIKFDTAIFTDSNNAEYHFLRLSIQEHAPKVVKYKGQLEQDRNFIILHFNKLSAEVQHAVIDYSKSSKFLGPHDFQN